jgi:hypothetical protein
VRGALGGVRGRGLESHADGFFDQLVLEHVSKDVRLDLEPVSTDDLTKQAAAVGVTLEDGKGILALNASIAGISVGRATARTKRGRSWWRTASAKSG